MFVMRLVPSVWVCWIAVEMRHKQLPQWLDSRCFMAPYKTSLCSQHQACPSKPLHPLRPPLPLLQDQFRTSGKKLRSDRPSPRAMSTNTVSSNRSGRYLGVCDYCCYCDAATDAWVSGTKKNPGRVFIKCARGMVRYLTN